MNRLILIGNGFDLAHGMATQYGDFMQDYIFNAFGLASKLNFYEDDLIAIQGKTYFTHFGIDWQSGLREYLDYFHNTNYIQCDPKWYTNKVVHGRNQVVGVNDLEEEINAGCKE